MGQGSFEDSIAKKFEGKGQRVSPKVWDNISNSLNAELVSQYQSSQSWYRWLTAAAILIAVSSFAIQYVSFSSKDQPIAVAYNALLSDDVDFSQFNEFSAYNPIEFSWSPIIVADEVEEAQAGIQVASDAQSQNIYAVGVASKKTKVELAMTGNFAMPYYRVMHQSTAKIPKEKTFWAGLEAGAGRFNPSFANGNSISNSVNSTVVATAVGAGNFANPSASATHNGMNDGTATSLGFDFGLKIGKKWTLESGLAYTNINNSGSASINVLDVFSNQKGTIAASSGNAELSEVNGSARLADTQSGINGEVDLNSNVQFASLPLKAGYYLMDDRFSLRLNAGFAANYLIENSLTDPSRQIINSEQSNLYNDWSFDGIGGLEFGYRLFKRVDMTIEPNFRHSITPLSNTISSPSRFAVQTGFRYTLR